MERRSFSRPEVAFLIGVPLAWAVLLLFHPTGEGGIEGPAATVSRLALVPFVVIYGLYEGIVGIGTGILVDEVNGLAGAEWATGASLVEAFTDSGLIAVFEFASAFCLLVALVAAGVALRRRAAAPVAVVVLLVVAAVPMAWHVPPFGPAALALFIVAVLLAQRGRAAPAPLGGPGPA